MSLLINVITLCDNEYRGFMCSSNSVPMLGSIIIANKVCEGEEKLLKRKWLVELIENNVLYGMELYTVYVTEVS